MRVPGAERVGAVRRERGVVQGLPAWRGPVRGAGEAAAVGATAPALRWRPAAAAEDVRDVRPDPAAVHAEDRVRAGDAAGVEDRWWIVRVKIEPASLDFTAMQK